MSSRLFWALVAIFYLSVLVWLLNKQMVFSGEMVLNRQNAFFSGLIPSGRVRAANQFTEIIGEPIYLDLKLPRGFDELEWNLTFENENLNQLSLGKFIDEERFDLTIVQNLHLDQRVKDPDWRSYREGDRLFLQKKGVQEYSGVTDFLSQLNPKTRVASLNYNLSQHFRLPDYQPSSVRRSFDRSFRGPHQLLVYLKNEKLDFEFLVQDLNRANGPDQLDINVSWGGKVITRASLEDDQNVSNNSVISETRVVSLLTENLPEGIYRVELNGGEDWLFRKIITTNSRWVFLDHLFLTDNPEYKRAGEIRTDPIVLDTSLVALKAFTPHIDGFQEISLDGRTVKVNRTHHWFHLQLSNPQASQKHRLEIPKGDLKIDGRGVFGLSSAQYFDPKYLSLESPNLTSDSFDYVVARYSPPETENRLTRVKIRFPLDSDKRRQRLIISAPNLDQSRPLKIYQNQLNLKGRPVRLSNFYNILNEIRQVN